MDNRWSGWGRWARAAAACVVTAVAVSSTAAAQTEIATDVRPADGRAADAVLQKKISVDIVNVSLGKALDAIAARAGVRVQYRFGLIEPYTTPVTLHETNTALGLVFERALAGTRLRVVPVRDGSVSVVRADSESHPASLGTIGGTIVDAARHAAVANATVLLTAQGFRRSAVTDAKGSYHFAEIPAGSYLLTVRVLGFSRQSQPVSVTDDHPSVVDFTLQTTTATLDQVVVTATGAQRYRELGHVVSQINADSVVREAPVSSLSELLTARVPGLQVLPGNGGTVGGDVALRLRGQTTTSLDPQPIVIVDGVRYRSNNLENTSVGMVSNGGRPFQADQRSPLNDLNVNDIENVEVVKGPSASTLYGPDAANGVIVITTKRGKAGKPVWHVYAYPDLSLEPKTDATAATGYRVWAHDLQTGENFDGCRLVYRAQPNPQCAVDSITTAPTALNDPNYNVFAKSRPQWHYGANVGGGVSALTYFFSGNYDSEIGALKISPLAERALKATMGATSLSDAIKNPNSQQMLTLHTNVASQLSSVGNVNFIADYTHADQRAIQVAGIFNDTYSRGVLPASLDTTNLSQVASYLPTTAFLKGSHQQLNRITGTVQGGMRPTPWFTANALIGTDIAGSTDRGVEPVGSEGPSFQGYAEEFRRTNTNRNAHLSLVATAHPNILSFRSTIGGDYMYTNLDGTEIQASGLPPGGQSIANATSSSLTAIWTETASLGTFGEEVVGINDRLFLTGSLRLDGSTTFGDAYRARPFPKFGASWIVTDEPAFQRVHIPFVTDLRLRASTGSSSRYPTSAMKYGSLGAGSNVIAGQTVLIFDRTFLANPLVRPERTRESEWGADLTLAGNTQVGLSWYSRRTNDQLNLITVPTAFLSNWGNVGDISAHGFEATFSTSLLHSRLANLDVNASYSHNTNKVLSLGSATGYKRIFGSLVVGAPLDASYGASIVSVTDSNSDGIIVRDEVTLSPVHYLGTFYAPNTMTFTPVLALLGTHLRISSLFDRQTGGVQRNLYLNSCLNTGTCIAPYLLTTPLLEQAAFLVAGQTGNIVSSDFTRWRELSITSDLPAMWRDRLFLSRASVSLQVRNLALWTSYKGPDPESVPGLGVMGRYSAQNGATGIPQARAWTLRFDIQP